MAVAPLLLIDGSSLQLEMLCFIMHLLAEIKFSKVCKYHFRPYFGLLCLITIF